MVYFKPVGPVRKEPQNHAGEQDGHLADPHH